MKVFTQSHKEAGIPSLESGRRLKLQLDDLQQKMIEKRLERKHEEVELLESEIDQLHRQLMAVKNS